MMWIAGVSPLDVLHAYVAAVPALLVGGWIASRQQHAHAPMRPAPAEAMPSTGAGSASSPRCCWRRWPPTSA